MSIFPSKKEILESRLRECEGKLDVAYAKLACLGDPENNICPYCGKEIEIVEEP